MSVQLLEKLFSLKGKTALISGGYKGIGRLFAETYAEAGADVAIVARNREACEKAAKEISAKYGVKTIGKSMDVHKTEIVNRVVQEITAEFGNIDILVNRTNRYLEIGGINGFGQLGAGRFHQR